MDAPDGTEIDADLVVMAVGIRPNFALAEKAGIHCENGIVVNVEKFTGEWAGSPWWNNTESILIEGVSGVICYGEIEVSSTVRNRKYVFAGEILGRVIPVLKKDKGKNPMNMLHIELYKKGTKESVVWNLDEDKPDNLLDVTDILKPLI